MKKLWRIEGDGSPGGTSISIGGQKIKGVLEFNLKVKSDNPVGIIEMKAMAFHSDENGFIKPNDTYECVGECVKKADIPVNKAAKEVVDHLAANIGEVISVGQQSEGEGIITTVITTDISKRRSPDEAGAAPEEVIEVHDGLIDEALYCLDALKNHDARQLTKIADKLKGEFGGEGWAVGEMLERVISSMQLTKIADKLNCLDALKNHDARAIVPPRETSENFKGEE
jgi:hypothetical protein